jgi:hypothetical protein
MASVELVVLVTVLLMGLFLGGMLPWFTQLLGTGHPSRRMAVEDGRPRGGGRDVEAGVARASMGALVAIVAVTIVLVLIVPGTVQGLSVLEDLPGGALTLSFAVLMVAVVFALPRWLGVQQ